MDREEYELNIHASLRKLAGGALIAVGLSLPLATATYADVENVQIIAAAGPGGGYDQLARGLQTVLEAEKLAADVQVINVPGAGGTIGLAQFIKETDAKDKALTVGLGMIGAIKVNNAPVNLDQVTPLARMIGEYQPLIVAANSPIKNLDDLKALYMKDPGGVSWGGFALGSPDHLISAFTVKSFGGDVSKMNYVVTGAGSEMLAQILGGHITVATGGLGEFADLIKSGQLRALAISSPERLPGIDIPTFKEQGYDVELVNWRGFVANSSASPEDMKAFDETISKAVASESWKKLVTDRNWVDLYQNAADFKAFLDTERPRLESIYSELNLAK